VSQDRPFPGYSLNIKGDKVSDLVIMKLLKDYRRKKEFQNWGGYQVF